MPMDAVYVCDNCGAETRDIYSLPWMTLKLTRTDIPTHEGGYTGEGRTQWACREECAEALVQKIARKPVIA